MANECDAGLHGITFDTTVDRADAEPVASIANFVEQHADGAAVIEDHDIGIAVVVEIASGRTPRHLQLGKCRPGTVRDIFKSAAALVVKQLTALLERIGIALLDLAAQVADGTIDDDHIEEAVVVVVDEAGAETGESKLEQTEFRRAVLEQPIADVQVERVAFVVQVRDEQILIAVAVNISSVNTHAPLRLPHPVDCHASQQCVVFEDAGPTLVDPQLICIAIVGDVQVGPAITINVGRQDSKPSP